MGFPSSDHCRSHSASKSELRRGSGEELGSSAVVNLTGLVTEARRGERRAARGAKILTVPALQRYGEDLGSWGYFCEVNCYVIV